MKNSFFLLLGLFLYGCQTSTQVETSSDTSLKKADTLTSTATKSPGTDTTTKVFKGLYISDDEVSTFRVCGSSEELYWTTDRSKQLSAAYKKSTSHIPYPYESIYLEVEGYLAGRSEIGYASEYPNELIVKKILKAEPKSFKTECWQYEFVALGNEPFWSLEINPLEQQIIFKDVASEKVYQFPYTPANAGGGVHRFDTKNQNDKIAIIIREES